MSHPLVSVVIPTVGRGSLEAAVGSALDQGVPVEVIVVNDSGAALAVPDGATVVDTAGRTGAAAARNRGMEAAQGRYIAFLDDDDRWLPGHLSHAVAHLERTGSDVYCCPGLVSYDSFARIEPVVPLGERTVLDYLFGDAIWRSRNRRILTPTLVFDRAWARVPMEEGLVSGQDTWWLLALEAAGATVCQGTHIGVHVDADTGRDGSRRRTRDDRAWAERLDTLRPGAGHAYLVGELARGAARRGDVPEVARVTMLAWRINPRRSVRWAPVALIARVVATVIGLRRRRS